MVVGPAADELPVSPDVVYSRLLMNVAATLGWCVDIRFRVTSSTSRPVIGWRSAVAWRVGWPDTSRGTASWRQPPSPAGGSSPARSWRTRGGDPRIQGRTVMTEPGALGSVRRRPRSSKPWVGFEPTKSRLQIECMCRPCSHGARGDYSPWFVSVSSSAATARSNSIRWGVYPCWA